METLPAFESYVFPPLLDRAGSITEPDGVVKA